MKCFICGHEAGFWAPRAMYSCLAHHCEAYNLPICHNCLVERRAGQGAFGVPERCPFCGVGELKFLGNQ